MFLVVVIENKPQSLNKKIKVPGFIKSNILSFHNFFYNFVKEILLG